MVALTLALSRAPVLEATTFLSPAGPEPIKQWSGVHLGVRPSADWNSTLYAQISGDRGGTWPDTIVLISDQFYNVFRDSNNRITRVDTGRPDTLSYLQRASQQGVAIIIRIQPSPGNFRQDSLNNHRLLLNAIDYTHGDGDCRNWENNCHRSPDDIGAHIIKIHDYNVAHGITEWGFESANEPNLEWYDDLNPFRNINTTPDQANSSAWQDMNAYFQTIYNYVKVRNVTIRVLTPAMAQGQFAEGADTLHPPACVTQLVGGSTTGYDQMYTTYRTYRDAISWHNYWRLGYEGLNGCPAGGQHVSDYLPDWLKVPLQGLNRTVEGFITEADLLSYPFQDSGQPIHDKDENGGMRAAKSIERFMYYELQSYHMADWLLNDLTGNPEYGWHEAYRDYSADAQIERTWFSKWWSGPEVWVEPLYLPLVLRTDP